MENLKYIDKWIGSYDFKMLVNVLREDFPLTYDMCKKNNYFGFFSWSVITRLYRDEHDKIIGIAIFDSRFPKHYHIYSFEIRKDHRLKGLGSEFLGTFTDRCEEVRLSSLPESKIFYQKLGFEEQEENQMIYRRNERC